MKHLFGKHVLVTAVAVLAVLCMMWPAQALKVTTGGVGKHLTFAYWTTMGYRDTYIAVYSPLGVKNLAADEPKNIVTINIRDGGAPEELTAEMYGGVEVPRPKSLASFDICLDPGDSWTAVIVGDGDDSMLVVGNPGDCDGDVVQPTGSRADNPLETPKPGEMITLKGNVGFIEAYSSAKKYYVRNLETDEQRKLSESDSASMSIAGTAYVVSPMMGFASNYNATALMCHDFDEGDANVRECRHNLNSEGTADTENEINTALTGGVDDADNPANNERRRLMGRWITDPVIGAMTDVVLTFPGSNTLNYQMKDSDGDDVAKMDPVSLFVFDEEGAIVADSRKVELPMAVNMCSFRMMMDDDGMMMTNLMCNDADIDSFGATAGGFQILNTAPDVDTDAGANLGLIDDAADAEDGTEYTGYNLEGIDNSAPLDGDTEDADDVATPTWDSIPAIGLVMSVFNVDGGDGMAVYDQMVPIWHTGEGE